jgi:hypothetical protein
LAAAIAGVAAAASRKRRLELVEFMQLGLCVLRCNPGAIGDAINGPFCLISAGHRVQSKHVESTTA